MEKIDSKNIPQSHFFLPHHCVFTIDSSTTKLRVVFDASVKGSSNLSLNDILLNAPVVQDDLFLILARFRFPTYAFSADLAKMYRKNLVSESDKNLKLVLWRNHPSEPFSVYRLNTVTYGTKPAPYLATMYSTNC